MRAGATGQPHDLSDPATLNLNVQSGDVITVTAVRRSFIISADASVIPGRKLSKPGSRLLQAILAAGGTTRKENHVEISREGSDGRLVTIRYNIKQIKSGAVEDPKLQPGDRIEVAR